MKTIHFILITLIICAFCFAANAQVKKESEKKTLADYFLIEKDKPSVYIKFEKSGMAEPLLNGEGKERYYLRLFNNSKGEISFCSFKVSQQYGEIGMVYDVEEYRPSQSGQAEEEIIPEVKTKKDTKNKALRTKRKKDQKLKMEKIEMPQGYTTGDFCLTFYLESGKSILFSIPQKHLIIGTRIFDIQIQFRYEWEYEGTEIAGQPLHIVSFSLPITERKGL